MPTDAAKVIDWRPMEYVPKDGRTVMLYTIENDLDGKDYMVGAYWRKHLQCWACSPGSRWGVIMGRPILWTPLLVHPAEPDVWVFESNSLDGKKTETRRYPRRYLGR